MKADICVQATLTLTQIAVVFDAQCTTRALKGQGKEIIFDDGSELIIPNSGGYLVYDKTTDIYKEFDQEGRAR
jgi:hypothetical protein